MSDALIILPGCPACAGLVIDSPHPHCSDSECEQELFWCENGQHYFPLGVDGVDMCGQHRRPSTAWEDSADADDDRRGDS